MYEGRSAGFCAAVFSVRILLGMLFLGRGALTGGMGLLGAEYEQTVVLCPQPDNDAAICHFPDTRIISDAKHKVLCRWRTHFMMVHGRCFVCVCFFSPD